MNKRSTLGYLPGGSEKYVDTLRKCLEYIRQEHPTQQQLEKWFRDLYGSQNKNVNASYVRTVKSLELTEESRGVFSVNHLGEEFLAKGNSNIVYQQLDQNCKGIADTLKILLKDSLTLDGVCSLLKKKVGKKWETPKPCEVRINWLRSLGYIVKDGSKYCLTAKGKRIIERKDEEGEPLKHDEIRDLIVKLGWANGHFSKPEFRFKSYKYDVAWKRLEDAPVPSHVFEIHKHGNLDRALRKLKFAHMNSIGDLFLIVDPKEKSKAEEFVRTTFNEIMNIIKIRTPTDMKEWYETSVAASEKAKTVGGYRGITLMLRKKKRSRT